MTAIVMKILGSESSFTPKEAREVRKFSYAASALGIFPFLLLALFASLYALSQGKITLNQGLAFLLVSFIAIYFLLPRIAGKIMQAIEVKKSSKRGE